MSDIEKEFFEAFGVEKVRECELRDECFLGFAHPCSECDVYGQAYEVYPTITSDIVLGLEEILIDKYKDIAISKNQGGWYHYTADINGKGLWEVSGSKNRTEQLLSLFILLKDNISEEVKALFKC